MKLICPDCGMQYDSGKFCQECGGKLQEAVPELVCPSCGYRAKSGKFCPECGSKFTEQIDGSETAKKEETVGRKFNEREERFAKYYDKKGFPRTVPQEERDIAIEELTTFADQNIAEAKMLLGNIFLGNHDDKDVFIKGLTLMKEAEQDGNQLAYYFMAVGYYLGMGTIVEQDHNEAEKRLLEAYQEYQDGETAGILAELYTFSEEKCDYKKAFKYATIAAEDDDMNGYFILGALYFNGWGVEKNAKLAMENYKMAAAFGHETAMNQLGIIFMGNDGVQEDPEQSFYWFNEASKKGSDVGMNNLGFCYKNGYGVEADIEKAAGWFKKSAELGYAEAMVGLGEYYLENLVDYNKAKMWYLKAAELEHPQAYCALGRIYNEGLGVEVDHTTALKWFEKAADAGVQEAIDFLNEVSNDNSIQSNGSEVLATQIQNIVIDTDGRNTLKLDFDCYYGQDMNDGWDDEYDRPYWIQIKQKLPNNSTKIVAKNYYCGTSPDNSEHYHFDIKDYSLKLGYNTITKLTLQIEVRMIGSVDGDNIENLPILSSCEFSVNIYHEAHFTKKNVLEIRD